MVRRRQAQKVETKSDVSKSAEEPKVKYPTPKILLMDIGEETEAVLNAEGYNVAVGSFGTPYRIPKSDRWYPVIPNGKLPPDYREQEILVVDLAVHKVLDEPVGEKFTSPGTPDWWANGSQGTIDPRPRWMSSVRKDCDRILSNGGIFVIFAAPRIPQQIQLAHVRQGYGIVKDGNVEDDNWSFLSESLGLTVNSDSGYEMVTTRPNTQLGQVLQEAMKDGHFECTVTPRWQSAKSRWLALAHNKYGDDVAGVLPTEEQDGPYGLVLILPQIKGKDRLVLQLMQEILPQISSHLFPHVEGERNWIHGSRYEHRQVLELESEILRVQQAAEEQINTLQESIQEHREQWNYLHTLLTGTGDALVDAVEKTLRVLGFEKVVNVDKQMASEGDNGFKREDLQIRDQSLILLVEIKGISAIPKDEDALQVLKYLPPRMQEWKTTDVQGLAVINHQRHIPALDRDNEHVFRDDILTNARGRGFGLMTTFDLFKLAHSYLRLGWSSEVVKPLFYGTGRIDPVPTHYQPLGVIERFAEDLGVVGIRIEEAALMQGDRIAFGSVPSSRSRK